MKLEKLTGSVLPTSQLRVCRSFCERPGGASPSRFAAVKTFSFLSSNFTSDRSLLPLGSSSLRHLCAGSVRVRPAGRRPDPLRPGRDPLQHRGHPADHQQGRPQLVAGQEGGGCRDCRTDPQP